MFGNEVSYAEVLNVRIKQSFSADENVKAMKLGILNTDSFILYLQLSILLLITSFLLCRFQLVTTSLHFLEKATEEKLISYS